MERRTRREKKGRRRSEKEVVDMETGQRRGREGETGGQERRRSRQDGGDEGERAIGVGRKTIQNRGQGEKQAEGKERGEVRKPLWSTGKLDRWESVERNRWRGRKGMCKSY